MNKVLSGFGFFEQSAETLSAIEAFNKYGPDDDRFYTSQGLDPIEQRKLIAEINNRNPEIVQKVKDSSIINPQLSLEEAINKSNNEQWINFYKENREYVRKAFDKIAVNNESKNALLELISNNNLTESSSNTIIKMNALHKQDDVVHHGLFALNGRNDSNPNDRIAKNLATIINDNDIEISASNERIGNIGITGKANNTGYYMQDVFSTIQNGERQGGANIAWDLFDKIDIDTDIYNEYFSKNFQIDSLWVTENYYQDNKEFVHSLLKDNNINSLDIIKDKEVIKTVRLDELDELENTGILTNKETNPSQEQKVKQINEPVNSKSVDMEQMLDKTVENSTKETTEKVTEQTVKNTTEETVEEVIKETERQTEHNFKETLEQAAKEMVEENTKGASKAATKSLPKKSLSGGGKFAIGIAIAGLVVGGAMSASDNDSKKKSKKTKAHSLPKSTNSEEIDNSYAIQMAQDISTYRYGKHMTGFVNF